MKAKGFTLIEVLVATVLLIIIVLALTEGIILGIRHNAYLKHRKEALYLAQNKINELASLPSNQLSNGSETKTIPPITYTINWTVNSTTTAKEIKVTVSWQEMNLSHSVTLNYWKRE